MLNIIYSEFARSDLDTIYNYICEKASANTAAEFLNELLDSIEKLAEFPDMGVMPRYPEIPGKVFIHGQYLVFYRTDEEKNRVEIARIMHGARDYIQELKG